MALNSNQTSSLSANSKQTIPYFTPVATIIGLAFLFLNILLLAIAKIYYVSIDQYTGKNQFDLLIFKKPNVKLSARRIYKNTKASEHNLHAAEQSGFVGRKILDKIKENRIRVEYDNHD